MVVAQNEKIVVPVRDQSPQSSPAAIVHVLLATALPGVVVVGVAARRAHLHVTGLGLLVLQARAGKPGAVEQDVKGRDGPGIAGCHPNHVNARAACRQRTWGGIGCSAGGVATPGVGAPGFADAAVALARIQLPGGRGSECPVNGPRIDLRDLSLHLNGRPGGEAGGLRGQDLYKSRRDC